MIQLLNLDRQYQSIKPEIDEAIAKVVESGEFLGGTRDNPFVRQFEEEFARYVGVKHCVGVGSGTDAIRIVYKAVGEIWSAYHAQDTYIPANTAYPVVEALIDAGYEYGMQINFVDCDSVTYNLDTKSPKVPYTDEILVINHQYGHPCDMDTVYAWNKDAAFIIEDCSHAHGARYKGRNVGTFGGAAVFSFNPTKILGAMGDAGCIVTDDDDLAQMCRVLADHGRQEKYTHDYVGWNSRLDGIQAAVLSVKLKYLEKWWSERQNVADWYWDELGHDDGIVLPSVQGNIRHAWHQFVIRVPNRDQVRAALLDKGIQTNIHYPLSLPEQPALKYLGYNPDDFVATKLSREILSLPINESMTDEEVEFVCEALKETLDETQS